MCVFVAVFRRDNVKLVNIFALRLKATKEMVSIDALCDFLIKRYYNSKDSSFFFNSNIESRHKQVTETFELVLF